jgi:hypothetical protein
MLVSSRGFGVKKVAEGEQVYIVPKQIASKFPPYPFHPIYFL